MVPAVRSLRPAAWTCRASSGRPSFRELVDATRTRYIVSPVFSLRIRCLRGTGRVFVTAALDESEDLFVVRFRFRHSLASLARRNWRHPERSRFAPTSDAQHEVLSAPCHQGKWTPRHQAAAEGDRVARITRVTLMDDLDGGQASETVYFSLNGRHYEIDLSAENAAKLRDALAPFVAAARRSHGGHRPPRTRAVTGRRGPPSTVKRGQRSETGPASTVTRSPYAAASRHGSWRRTGTRWADARGRVRRCSGSTTRDLVGVDRVHLGRQAPRSCPRCCQRAGVHRALRGILGLPGREVFGRLARARVAYGL